MNLIYVPLVGFWLCSFLVAMGILVCFTIIFIPFGLTLIALGFKVLTLNR